MPFLTAAQRGLLEKTVVRARQAAETGARNALRALAVEQAEAFGHLSAGQRSLRNALRARGRLLGDDLRAGGDQQAAHLADELAYEYWHRMLFARFLSVNGLLLYDGVPVTLDDCEELAADEGFPDRYTAAAAYASRMLPALFRPQDPLLQVELATEDRIRLEGFLTALPDALLEADDALGWVYQFWQSEAKERINRSGDKIDGARLPAVTQLFTEPYMVQFLIDNTLGAWWVARHPGQSPPVPFRYLRRLPDGSPAAGSYPGWPDRTADLTLLDPCMGSGHLVAEALRTLVPLRMHEEGLSAPDATAAVLRDNLHGLELDPRCTQIAAFNLALTAWKLSGGYGPLPELNLACSGRGPTGKRDDWMALLNDPDPTQRARLRNGMGALFDLFQQAPTLGSLLDPATLRADAFTASFAELRPGLLAALGTAAPDEQAERGVVALGLARAGQLLARRYTLQLTNVPYLARGKQAPALAGYGEANFPEAKADLATVFLDRMLQSAQPGGTVASVIPQNWLFLTTYRKFRERLLKTSRWNFVARLGPKGFQTPMWDFNVMLVALSHQKPDEQTAFLGLDVAEEPTPAAKDAALRSVESKQLGQRQQLGNPDARVVLEEAMVGVKLETYAKGLQGIATGDFSRFGRNFWELPAIDQSEWIFQQTTFTDSVPFDGKSNIIHWENGKGELCQSPGARIQGLDSLKKKGVSISQMSTLVASLNLTTVFDNNTSVILPNEDSHLPAIWAYCSSPQFNVEVRRIDQALKVTNATLVKVPFDLAHWQGVAAEQYPAGLPAPYSDDPTQWLFHGHAPASTAPLQVALARLLGYRWPAETDPTMELSDQARAYLAEAARTAALVDDDGILCLPPVNGELAAAERLREFLAAAYGPAWSAHTTDELLRRAGSSKTTLDAWLRDEAFEQHLRLFGQRPFLWHVWDGRRDGFSAFVNAHRLDAEGLQKLIYTYLGDYLRQAESRLKAGESGADGQVLAARALQDKLKAIQTGEPPYDIFVRWKSLAQQPLGWQPDPNDGIRLNIRPFVLAEVLRKRPAIKWGTDRGRNAPGAPWGDLRDNDRHLTLDEKRKAREG